MAFAISAFLGRIMQVLAFVLVLIIALIGLLMPVPKSGTTYNEAVTESYNEGLEVGTARGVMIVQQTAAEKGMGEFYDDAEGTTRFRWFQNGTPPRPSDAVTPVAETPDVVAPSAVPQ